MQIEWKVVFPVTDECPGSVDPSILWDRSDTTEDKDTYVYGVQTLQGTKHTCFQSSLGWDPAYLFHVHVYFQL
jgi:hypothetical protein